MEKIENHEKYILYYVWSPLGRKLEYSIKPLDDMSMNIAYEQTKNLTQAAR